MITVAVKGLTAACIVCDASVEPADYLAAVQEWAVSAWKAWTINHEVVRDGAGLRLCADGRGRLWKTTSFNETANHT